MTHGSRKKTLADAVCPFCGCTCDDIDLVVEDRRIVDAISACPLGKARLQDHPTQEGPACTLGGCAVSCEEGIERAAQILTAARYPLIYGLSDTTCEAQRRAAAIADWVGGTIDIATGASLERFTTAFQAVGEVTATLGEIRHRADLVIYWGADPAESHPRHTARYTLMPKGHFVPRGRADRTCVVIDVRTTKSTQDADLFLQIGPNSDFEALWLLRALAKGLDLNAVDVESATGVRLTAWQDLVERMKRARYGVLFFGTGLVRARGDHLVSEAALALVAEMNRFTRFVGQPVCGNGNVVGAANVLTWRTGYPFGVNLSRGYPRFCPGEYSAADMLARREVDAALVIGADPMGELGPSAREHLASIPLVVVDSRDTPTKGQATVAFTSAPFGISVPGTVYRMDDVPLPLRPALPSSYPSDEEILTRLEARIRELGMSGPR